MTGIRKRHSCDIKLKVVCEALAGAKSIAQIASEHGVHPTQIKEWKTQALEAMGERFSMRRGKKMETPEEALEDALTHGTPDIHNTDQGSQFTGEAFTAVLHASGVAIGMDGKGSYQDNIFTERLWRSVKYEEVYTKEYVTLEQAKSALTACS